MIAITIYIDFFSATYNMKGGGDFALLYSKCTFVSKNYVWNCHSSSKGRRLGNF